MVLKRKQVGKKMQIKKRCFLTAKEAKRIDLMAQEKFKIPALLLMENAGRQVAEEVIKVAKNKKARIAIFCGRGNNAGDGLCAARHLLSRGLNPDVFLCGDSSKLKPETKKNLKILLKLKKKIHKINAQNLNWVKRKIMGYTIIVDALLGIGLKKDVYGIIAKVIELINRSGAYIISVDIPSGLNTDTGKVMGVAVKADKTITFVAPKEAMAKETGRKICAEVVIKDIGFPF